jgi:hypothetical protein
MHGLRKRYVSESLFPLFSNRLLDSSCPEYPDYVQWLGIHDRFALVVETEKPVKVGYCPRYLNQDLRRVMDIAEVKLTVERSTQTHPCNSDCSASRVHAAARL